jgi:glycosyltransferase involved in cell wall biosynthesis
MGITRARNESAILGETLDHFGEICDLGIILCDDCSEDDTLEIAERHCAVVEVIRNERWRTNGLVEEYRLRQSLLVAGRAHAPDWFCYFDADERIEWDFDIPVGRGHDAVAMKLFDAYITEQDRRTVGTERKWFGPEYREISMLFRNLPAMRYYRPNQRNIAGTRKPYHAGYVKHFGKAISVQEWERTCDYYAEYFPEPYRSKWLGRKGRAVHTMSDFGRPLMTWDEAKRHGICIGRL